MSKILTVFTDHRFYYHQGKFYDNYVFTHEFFIDYLKIFDEVKVVARVQNVKTVNNLKQSSGEGVSFFPIKDIHGLKWFFSRRSSFLEIEEIVKGSDALCFRVPSILSWHAYQFAKQLSKPYIFELIGDPEHSLYNADDSFLKRLGLKVIGKRASHFVSKIVDGAIGGSYVSYKHLQERFPARQEAYIESISSIRLPGNNILDAKQLNKKHNPFRIIHVGSFVAVKNQATIIKAIKLLKEREIKVECTFLGDGALKERAMQLALKLNVLSNITFVGHVTGTDKINAYLDDADLFVLPSTSEGMPRSMIEAMARGLPSVGTNVGGIKELLPKDCLFDVNDTKHLADYIASIINDDNMWFEMSQHSIKTAKGFVQEKLVARRIGLLNYLKSKTNIIA